MRDHLKHSQEWTVLLRQSACRHFGDLPCGQPWVVGFRWGWDVQAHGGPASRCSEFRPLRSTSQGERALASRVWKVFTEQSQSKTNPKTNLIINPLRTDPNPSLSAEREETHKCSSLYFSITYTHKSKIIKPFRYKMDWKCTWFIYNHSTS